MKHNHFEHKVLSKDVYIHVYNFCYCCCVSLGTNNATHVPVVAFKHALIRRFSKYVHKQSNFVLETQSNMQCSLGMEPRAMFDFGMELKAALTWEWELTLEKCLEAISERMP